MKQVPFKNYVKVFILFAITLLVCNVLYNNYKSKKEFENAKSNYFDQNIKVDELTSFLKEYRDGYIYMAPSDSLDKNFIDEIKNIINEYDLEHDFVYLDNYNFNELDYEIIKSNLSDKNISFNTTSNIFYINDGLIVDVYSNPNMNEIDSLRKFIDNNQVKND